MGKISAVLNVVDEEIGVLPTALSSLKNLVDEIVIIDATTSEELLDVAKKFDAKVFPLKRSEYVEKVRNFGISKATGEWILILDPDEELPRGLSEKIKNIVKNPKADYFRIPRKNIIFGKWMKHSRWWPDYNIRFFRKGKVVWNEIIHSVPMTQGIGADLPDKEELAIVHSNYLSVEHYLSRMNRYTKVEVDTIKKSDYKFIWKDLIKKPLGEFLSRYFAGEGYKDGLHGLAVAGLQAFSEFILYLKIWQSEKFLEQGITLPEINKEIDGAMKETNWWTAEVSIRSKGLISSIPERISRKFLGKK